MKLTKKLEAEILKVYNTYWESYSTGDIKTFATTLDKTFEMIGTSETEICHTKEEGIKFVKAQIKELVGKVEMRNRKISVVPVHEMMLVNERCDIYIRTGQEWKFYSKIRISTFLRKTNSGWKVFQQHGSLPDMRVEEGETLALKKINRENLQLRDAIKRRTIELEEKNRELEIEASLERVRSRTMAMNKTSELQEVIHVVHKELIHLNLSIDGGSFVVINADVDPELRCWGSGGTADTSEEILIPHFNMPFCTNLIKGIKKRQGFFSEEFSQKEKKEFFTKLFNQKPWSQISSKQKKETLSNPGGYTRSVAVSKHTSIFIINHQGKKFTDAENDILKRFAKVFEQTYTRFLDLQKAEAQAKESEIQLALERVRARSLAMHHTSELQDVVNITAQ